MQYDPETNKMVGFVLPCTEEGLPRTDSFLTTSFDQMQQCFCGFLSYAFPIIRAYTIILLQDRQNYDAITSDSVLGLFLEIPEAMETFVCISVYLSHAQHY